MKNNEPVAWRRVIGNVTKHYEYNEVGVGEPLYDLETVRQLKAEIEALKSNVDAIDTSEQYVDKSQNNRHDLTDEEIEEVGRETLSYWDSYDEGLMLFAKAILRKAQDK